MQDPKSGSGSSNLASSAWQDLSFSLSFDSDKLLSGRALQLQTLELGQLRKWEREKSDGHIS